MEKTFKEIFEELGIEEYSDRIFHSNSHGELFHLLDYEMFYRLSKENAVFKEIFPLVFKEIVDFAEKNWERPESIFQHMPKMMQAYFKG